MPYYDTAIGLDAIVLDYIDDAGAAAAHVPPASLPSNAPSVVSHDIAQSASLLCRRRLLFRVRDALQVNTADHISSHHHQGMPRHQLRGSRFI